MYTTTQHELINAIFYIPSIIYLKCNFTKNVSNPFPDPEKCKS